MVVLNDRKAFRMDLIFFVAYVHVVK